MLRWIDGASDAAHGRNCPLGESVFDAGEIADIDGIGNATTRAIAKDVRASKTFARADTSSSIGAG
jgi:hypothetical protein